jgi:hypothetical protein
MDVYREIIGRGVWPSLDAQAELADVGLLLKRPSHEAQRTVTMCQSRRFRAAKNNEPFPRRRWRMRVRGSADAVFGC